MRPTLVGEAPAPRRNREPLDGPAGDRLAQLAGMVDRSELLDRFDAFNLIGRWPGSSGKGSAWSPQAARRAARRKPLRGTCVILGRRVAAAYGLADLPMGLWLVNYPRWEAVVIPHPSGVNRLYNEEAWRALARVALDEALVRASLALPV